MFVDNRKVEGLINIQQLIILAAAAESIWETLKLTWEKDAISFDRLGAILVSVLVTVGTGVDLFEMVGSPIQIPYLGPVLTGIIISRGANLLHDLMKITEVVKIKNKN